MRYWQPLLAKPTETCSLRHPENKRQRSVNSFRTCIFGNHGIAQIFACVTAQAVGDGLGDTKGQYRADGKELVLQKRGDVDRRGDGVGI